MDIRYMNTARIGIALLATIGLAQSQTAAPVTFEAASVRSNTSGTRIGRITGGLGNPRFAATNVTLRMLLTLAFNVRNFEISGATGLIDSERYDIEAKAGESKPTAEQSRSMLQALLADRFKLAAHRETKEMPIYVLLPDKNGVKLTEPKEGSCVVFVPNSPPPLPGQPRPVYCSDIRIGPNSISGAKIPMAGFVAELSVVLGRPVVDKTGYTGTFDVRLEFSSEGMASYGVGGFGGPVPLPPGVGGDAVDPDSRPTIFTAVQEQMGLKLESQRGPSETLVIDHIEKPAAN
jgi:uncharacterized protein (TIGR03435 family)